MKALATLDPSLIVGSEECIEMLDLAAARNETV